MRRLLSNALCRVCYRGASMLSPAEEAALRAALDVLRRDPTCATPRCASSTSDRAAARARRAARAGRDRRGARRRASASSGRRRGASRAPPTSTRARSSRAARARRSRSRAPRRASRRAPCAFPERAAARGTLRDAASRSIPSPSRSRRSSPRSTRPVRALLARRQAASQSAEAWMEWTRQRQAPAHDRGHRHDAVAHVRRVRHAGLSRVGDDGVSQRRSYPTWQGGDGFQAGYERVARARPHRRTSTRIARRGARAPHRAALPRRARAICILDSSQVALQIHESCGHPTELDRALGSGDLARRRLVPAAAHARQAALRLAPSSTLVADSTSEGGIGTFGWDDEGVAGGHARARRARALRRLPLEPRDRRRARPRVDRHDARRGLEPPAAHPHGQRVARAGRRARSRISSPTPTTASRARPTRAGASTTSASTSSSRARSPGRSSTASARASSAIRSTPASRRASGGRATRSAAPRSGASGASRRAARATRCRSMQVGHGAAPARFREVTGRERGSGRERRRRAARALQGRRSRAAGEARGGGLRVHRASAGFARFAVRRARPAHGARRAARRSCASRTGARVAEAATSRARRATRSSTPSRDGRGGRALVPETEGFPGFTRRRTSRRRRAAALRRRRPRRATPRSASSGSRRCCEPCAPRASSAPGCSRRARRALAVATTRGLRALARRRRSRRSRSGRSRRPGAGGAAGYGGHMHRDVARARARARDRARHPHLQARHATRSSSTRAATTSCSSPRRVAELLEWLATIAFGAPEVEQGHEPARAGASASASPARASTLVEDPLDDADARLRRARSIARAPWRRACRSSSAASRAAILYDRTYAARARRALDRERAARRRSAARAAIGAPTLHMGAGDAASVDELIAGIDRGLYVCRLHYVNGLLEPPSRGDDRASRATAASSSRRARSRAPSATCASPTASSKASRAATA